MSEKQAEALLIEMAESSSKMQTGDNVQSGEVANDPVAKKAGLLSRFIR